MQIEKITAVVFSATGLTKKTLSVFTQALSLPVQVLDVTEQSADQLACSFGPQEWVIFAAPVYGGRIPAAAARRFARMKGSHTPATLLAVFGNRDYDDALLEMQDIALAGGFVPFACAAPVAEHSLMHSVAKGRPDEADAALLKAFAKEAQQKLAAVSDVQELAVPPVKGHRPYMDYPSIPFKPAASADCVRCGQCVKACPVGAIPPDDPTKTDASRCISCMRCVTVCPHGARGLNKLLLAAAEKVFWLKCGKRKEPEFFIAK